MVHVASDSGAYHPRTPGSCKFADRFCVVHTTAALGRRAASTPYAKPAAVYKGITRGFTVSTVPVMLAALPFAPRPPRGGFASSQLGGSGNRSSAFRTSPQVFTTGVAPRHHQPRHAIPSLPLPSADACCEGSLGAGLPSPRERGFPWARLTAAIAIVGEVFSHHVAPACRFTRAHAWRWALRRIRSGMLHASPRYATAHAAG